jgi:hypothetical protein
MTARRQRRHLCSVVVFLTVAPPLWRKRTLLFVDPLFEVAQAALPQWGARRRKAQWP